jgi:transcription initiation factor IIE alpha subunit
MQLSEKDMAVVIMDALSYHDGWVTEDNFAKKIQLGGKQVRRMLQFLQKQGFVVREHRREKKQGNKVESVAEQEQILAESRTATYVSIDYPHFYDMLRLRIALAKKRASERIDDGKVRAHSFESSTQLSQISAPLHLLAKSLEFCGPF